MTIFERFYALRDLDFCLAYLDNFDDTATDGLIAMQDARLQTAKKLRKKISFLVTECFQNIIRHSDESNLDFDKLFVVQSKGNSHKIITINPVSIDKKEALVTSMNHLEQLSESDLKEIYLNSLTGNNFSTKGGAGLGLIEMYRKTNRAPNFDFYPISGELVAFKLELEISEDEPDFPSENALDLEFYRDLSRSRILILQKSDFSQETVLSLFELIENNQSNPQFNAVRSKKLYLLIELLQNMSANHASDKNNRDGIFQISLTKNHELLYETGNCIRNDQAELLKTRLESILNLNKIELIKAYKKELMKGLDDQDTTSRAGIGLLEIIKLTEGRLSYQIDPISDSISFITFRAIIDK